VPSWNKDQRRHLVSLIMREKFLRRRIDQIAARGGVTTWDDQEAEALRWAVGEFRAAHEGDVQEAEAKAEVKWAARTTVRGEPRETLIGAVCRLVGVERPGDLVAAIEALVVHQQPRPLAVLGCAGGYEVRASALAWAVLRGLVDGLRDQLQVKDAKLAAYEERTSVPAAVLSMARRHVDALLAEKGSAANPHPDGCWTDDPARWRDCCSDGHHACKSCTRREVSDV